MPSTSSSGRTTVGPDVSPTSSTAVPKGRPAYYDFSGRKRTRFRGRQRAFAVTDIDGDGNLDIVLKSRLGPQIAGVPQ